MVFNLIYFLRNLVTMSNQLEQAEGSCMIPALVTIFLIYLLTLYSITMPFNAFEISCI